jgi:Rrf2 family protein
LVQLASLPPGESLTLPQISKREGISQANAGKLMWLLSKGDFVTATRGTKGGYSLSRSADEIRLSQVIKILDDDEIAAHCEGYKGIEDTCVHTGDCGIRPVIVGLHEVVQKALSNITLAQLVGSERKVDERFHRIQGLHSTLNI